MNLWDSRHPGIWISCRPQQTSWGKPSLTWPYHIHLNTILHPALNSLHTKDNSLYGLPSHPFYTTLFSKRSAHWFCPIPPVTLGHWPWPGVMSILSNGLDSNMQKTPFENSLRFSRNSKTRQLPMGGGHCQWGGFTDQNVCNKHGEEHLASRCASA